MLYDDRFNDPELEKIFEWGKSFAAENTRGEYIDIPSLVILLHSMHTKIEELEKKVDLLEYREGYTGAF